MTTALRGYADVKVAYLLKRFDPDGTCHFVLDIVFDGEADSEAQDAANRAWASVAPPEKSLEMLLLTPELQAQVIEQANALPFYERN